jgi:two-component system cell cycle response regulator CtrA
MNVLLIADDRSFAASLALSLRSASIGLDTAFGGRKGIRRTTNGRYDLVLVDVRRPDLSGTEIIRRIRARGQAQPIIVLSASASVASKVEALTSGADDYLTKPVALGELIARMDAVCRRCTPPQRRLVTVGRFTVNLDQQAVSVDGRQINVTPREYQLLELLACRKGAILSRAAVMSRLYAEDETPATKAIDVFICRLRKKLSEAADGPHGIETVPGRGYRLRIGL